MTTADDRSRREQAMDALSAPPTRGARTRRPFFQTFPGALVIVAIGLVIVATMLWSAAIGVLEVVILGVVALTYRAYRTRSTLSATERYERSQVATHGPVLPEVRCPHCGERGDVHVQYVQIKQGISGGKATGAILTGGASLLLTGLSRKGFITRLHCENCTMTWSQAA